jgi:hypothetical protein
MIGREGGEGGEARVAFLEAAREAEVEGGFNSHKNVGDNHLVAKSQQQIWGHL